MLGTIARSSTYSCTQYDLKDIQSIGQVRTMGRRNVKPKGGKKERDVFETANPVGEFDGIQSSESSEEEPQPQPQPERPSKLSAPGTKKAGSVRKNGKTKPTKVSTSFFGVPLFAAKMFRVYFIITLCVEMGWLLLLWAIQLEVDTDESYSLVVMAGGILVGLQLSQVGGHWQASTDREEPWQTAKTVRAHVLRGERVKWHVTMIFYPIVVLIVMTLMYNVGLYTLIVYYTGSEHKCVAGVIQGIQAIYDLPGGDGQGARLVYSFSLLYFLLLVFMSLLSVTHYRQYMKLHVYRMQYPVEVEDEGEEEVDVNGNQMCGLVKARYIKRLYVLSILTQASILLMLTYGKESTNEPNLLYSTLMFGVFLLGWQVGVGERHLHFDAGVDPKGDDALIRDRTEWHGSMMFYPCAVSVFQCFYNFSALFTLLPYFNDDCTQTSIGKILGNLDLTGTLIFWSNVGLFFLTFVALLWLCILHFVQFQNYQRLQDL